MPQKTEQPYQIATKSYISEGYVCGEKGERACVTAPNSSVRDLTSVRKRVSRGRFKDMNIPVQSHVTCAPGTGLQGWIKEQIRITCFT